MDGRKEQESDGLKYVYKLFYTPVLKSWSLILISLSVG